MIPTRYLCLALASAVGLMSSCSSTPEVAEDTALGNRAWWSGDGVDGERKILIDLTAQRLRYLKGGKLVGVSPISSGKEGTNTRNGSFRVIEKDIDHRSSVFGAFVDDSNNVVVSDVDVRKDKAPPGSKFMGASMRYCMRIVGGFCMHEGYLPGYPASHGCVRLPTRMAEILFNETPVGTPVEIVGHSSLAGTEEEVPLGKGEVAAAPPEPSDGSGGEAKDKKKAGRPREIVRRAVVADAENAGSSLRYQAVRAMKRKHKPGETVYLE